MKKIYKQILIFLIPLSLLILVIFFFNIIKSDFKYAHQSSMVYNKPFNFQKYLILSTSKEFLNTIIKPKVNNFKKINFFIEEQNIKKLITRTPLSTKTWVDGKISLNNNKMKKIQYRYRGDNPVNWMFKKKSFKIKTRKSQLINNARSFDFLIYSANLFSSYFLSKKMSLVTQDFEIVDVDLNGFKKGLYIKLNKIDESFLRQNKIMPVNIFKGENHSTEKLIGLNENLFNNASSWTKVAIFNQKEDDDNSDLNLFLSQLNQNYSSLSNKMNNYIDLKYFSRFEAFLTLTQNNHHDWFHNLRIISDPWKGKFYRTIADPMIYEKIPGKSFLLDFASNDLSKFFNTKSNFIHEKYKSLDNFLNKEDIVDDLAKYFISIKSDLLSAEDKEPYMIDRDEYIISFSNVLKKLENNKKKILFLLENNFSKSFWSFNNSNNIELIIGQETPVTNIQLTYDAKYLPKWVGVDQNYDNKIDSSEPKFFFKNNLNNITIPLIFYSNRINKTSKETSVSQEFELMSLNTKFRIIASNKKKPKALSGENYFTKKKYELKFKNKNNAVRANKNNIIISETNTSFDVVELSGDIIIDEDKVFERPVKILKGTKFHIHPEKHIIFKNNVEAIGDEKNPIFFKRINSKAWGSIVLLGDKTKNSIFKYVNFEGGSGGYYNQFLFTSMFSIHNTNNINVTNCNFYSNLIFDDTIHVVYSEKIKFKNINIINAYSDALDIDVSEKIYLENVKIINPGNDGVDFMESSAKVINLKIEKAKDKGISVGENSSIKIYKSLFINNKIAIAVKDKSNAEVHESDFQNNNYQLASYAKNWRYSGGGKVKVFNSNFKSNINKFTVLTEPGSENNKEDKKLLQNSSINIVNSTIKGNTLTQGKNIFFN